MSLGSGYDASCLCHFNLVTSVMVFDWCLIIVPCVHVPCLNVILLQLIL